MPSPIADSMSICNWITLVLFGAILAAVAFSVLTNTNTLLSNPAVCAACPRACSSVNDCPAVLFSSNFNASRSCTNGGCVYEYVPLSTVPLPAGPIGDQYCNQKLLRAPPCFSIYSLGNCNGMLIECYGSFLCQFNS